MNMRLISSVPMLLLSVVTLSAAPTPLAAQRQRLSMDPNWRFTLGDPAGAEQPKFDHRRWWVLDLPHDWSIEGTPREDAPAGAAWPISRQALAGTASRCDFRPGPGAGWRGSSSTAST